MSKEDWSEVGPLFQSLGIQAREELAPVATEKGAVYQVLAIVVSHPLRADGDPHQVEAVYPCAGKRWHKRSAGLLRRMAEIKRQHPGRHVWASE